MAGQEPSGRDVTQEGVEVAELRLDEFLARMPRLSRLAERGNEYARRWVRVLAKEATIGARARRFANLRPWLAGKAYDLRDAPPPRLGDKVALEVYRVVFLAQGERPAPHREESD